MKKTISIILSIVMLLSTFTFTNISAMANTVYDITVDVEYKQGEARTILSMINDMRTGSDAWYWNSDNTTKTVCKDLNELKYDYTLEKAAMQRATEISLMFSHTRPDNTSCFSVASELGISYYTLGENIAMGYSSASSVHKGWREDNDNYSGQGHRRNMLSADFNSVGIACAVVNGVKYWVEEFAYIPNVNTSKTAENNRLTEVSVRVADSVISSVELQVANKINLDIVDEVSLPDVNAVLVTNDFYGWSYPVVKPVASFSVADENIVSINDGELKANKIGKTTITVSALGKTAVINVTVTCKHNYSEISRTNATCTENGSVSYYCNKRGAEKTEALKALGHKFNYDVITKADVTKKTNGKATSTCTVCGESGADVVIYYPKTITLSQTSYTYDGKAKKPTVTVKDSKGNTIASSNYTVTYSNNKNVGKATVKITFKGNYSGTKTVYFTINPKGTSVSSVTALSKGFTVKWKKQSTQTTGYQIQYATDSAFKKNVKTVTVSKNSTTSKKITKLKSKKKYYVRVRTYKTVNGTKYYSAWSKAKTVTTKK